MCRCSSHGCRTWRILLHPRAHEKHHTDPNFDRNFCIFTGHTNALVNVGWLAVRMWQGRADNAIDEATFVRSAIAIRVLGYWQLD